MTQLILLLAGETAIRAGATGRSEVIATAASVRAASPISRTTLTVVNPALAPERES
jgi:hypothetical protein